MERRVFCSMWWSLEVRKRCDVTVESHVNRKAWGS